MTRDKFYVVWTILEAESYDIIAHSSADAVVVVDAGQAFAAAADIATAVATGM